MKLVTGLAGRGTGIASAGPPEGERPARRPSLATSRESCGHAPTLDAAKAAFRPEYFTRKGTEKIGPG